jgi:phytoene dehydrogenase-like protein
MAGPAENRSRSVGSTLPSPALRSFYDVIVIGAGHNGLVCAAYLARAGKSVLVLERRHVVGGACVTEELWPGFQVSVCAYVNSLFRRRLFESWN